MDNKEKDIFYKLREKLTQEDLSHEIPSWQSFSPKVGIRNFLTWGIMHFNVYYLILLLALCIVFFLWICDALQGIDQKQVNANMPENELVRAHIDNNVSPKSAKVDNKESFSYKKQRVDLNSKNDIESNVEISQEVPKGEIKKINDVTEVTHSDTIRGGSNSIESNVEDKGVITTVPITKDSQKVIIKNKRIITKKDSVINQKTRKLYD